MSREMTSEDLYEQVVGLVKELDKKLGHEDQEFVDQLAKYPDSFMKQIKMVADLGARHILADRIILAKKIVDAYAVYEESIKNGMNSAMLLKLHQNR